jgi:hypothetical protein
MAAFFSKKPKALCSSDLKNTTFESTWSSPKIPSTPFMEEEGIEVLKEELLRARVFLEYGSGGSTVMASGYPGLKIHSIDSDEAFLIAVKDRCIQEFPECNLSSHHVEIGPTSEWGVPSDLSKANLWPSYSIKPWEEFRKESIKPDLILVDGRFRVSCFLVSLALAPLGTVILFDDYTNRNQYHMVERYLFPESIHGRMARFRKITEPNLADLLPNILSFCTESD